MQGSPVLALLLIVALLLLLPTASHGASAASAASDDAAVDGFDVATAKQHLYFSYAAYCSDGNLTDWACTWCAHNPDTVLAAVVYDKISEAKGYVAYQVSTGRLIISFRGSSNIPNWIADLEFLHTVEYDGVIGARVHSGFYLTYKGVRSQVHAAVHAVLSGPCPHCANDVLVTGHSLGGALAGLAAIDLAINGSLVTADAMTLATFGMPRVGNKRFVTDVFEPHLAPTRVTRMVHMRDVVPRLPLKGMGFHHVPTEVWEHPVGNYTVCDGTGEDKSCSDSLHVALSAHDHVTYMEIDCCAEVC